MCNEAFTLINEVVRGLIGATVFYKTNVERVNVFKNGLICDYIQLASSSLDGVE